MTHARNHRQVYAVALDSDEISKIVAILNGARAAAIDMKEPEVSQEIGRLAKILQEAREAHRT